MDEKEKVNRILSRYTGAFFDENPEKIKILWSEDGILMPPGCRAFVGRLAIWNNYRFQFEYLRSICHWVLYFEPERFRFDTGLSHVIGSLKDVLEPFNGGRLKERIIHRGKFFMLLERNKKSWKIKYFIWNLDEIDSYLKRYEILSQTEN